jgi:hypothetical protein
MQDLFQALFCKTVRIDGPQRMPFAGFDTSRKSPVAR